MRSLLLLLALLLLAGCPKKDPEAAGGGAPPPTPTPRAEAAPEPDPEPSPEATPEAATRPPDASRRVVQAVALRTEGSEAAAPEGLELLHDGGDVIVVRGNPRLLPTGGDWSTAAMLGDDSAAAKIADLPGLLSALAARTDPLRVSLALSEDAPEDAAAKLAGLQITVESLADGVATANLSPSGLGPALGTGWVTSLTLAPVTP